MFDIVGMGNAIVILTTIARENQAYMNMHFNGKGGFFQTRTDEFEEILHFSKNHELSAGGSVANSMKVFASLGGSACFVGKIGMDKYGTFFTNQLKDYNIYPGLSIDKEEATGCLVALKHENGEKSICVKLRASKIIPFNAVNMELVSETKILFVEGFWLDNNLLTVKKVINAARKNLVRIALSLGNLQIVAERKDFFAKYLSKVDVLFGTDEEFEVLGDCVLPSVAVKMSGNAGVDVYYQGKWRYFQPLNEENSVYTTEARDAFFGGFLFGMSRGKPIDKAVTIGQFCAVNAIQSLAPNACTDLKELLKNDFIG